MATTHIYLPMSEAQRGAQRRATEAAQKLVAAAYWSRDPGQLTEAAIKRLARQQYIAEHGALLTLVRS